MTVIDKALSWLTPEKRKAIYLMLGILGTVVVSMGYANDSLVTGVIGVIDAALAVVFLILASIKAKRMDWTIAYGVFAALIAAVRIVGWIDLDVETNVLMILDALGRIAPFIAFFRTDTGTPTGEPSAEYVARHAVNDSDVVVGSIVDLPRPTEDDPTGAP